MLLGCSDGKSGKREEDALSLPFEEQVRITLRPRARHRLVRPQIPPTDGVGFLGRGRRILQITLHQTRASGGSVRLLGGPLVHASWTQLRQARQLQRDTRPRVTTRSGLKCTRLLSDGDQSLWEAGEPDLAQLQTSTESLRCLDDVARKGDVSHPPRGGVELLGCFRTLLCAVQLIKRVETTPPLGSDGVARTRVRC